MLIFNWISIIALIGFVQGIFISSALFLIKSKNRNSNILLGIFILLLAFTLAGRLEYDFMYFKQHPDQFLYQDIILFLFGPTLFLYFKSLFDANFKLTIKYYYLFIPAVIHILFTFYTVFITVEEVMQIFYLNPLYWTLTEGLALAHNIVYLIIIQKIFNEYKRNVLKVNSYLEDTKFIQVLMVLLITSAFVWLGHYLTKHFGVDIAWGFDVYKVIWIALSLFAYVFGYYAIFSPKLFRISFVGNSNGALKLSEIDELKTKLLGVINDKKPYLDPELTLQKLSEITDINKADLSKLFSEGFNKNFYELINEYRVDHFKELVKEESLKNNTILSLAYDSGFKSKTTFNVAFKRITDQTPKEFIRVKLEK